MVAVILVEPKNQGNVGAVARAMANFGFDELYLVNPPELEKEAYDRAVHAGELLQNAKVSSSFGEAIKGFDYIAGTSSDISASKKNPSRNFLTASEFADKIKGFEGKVAIAFGREDHGLSNEEVDLCDSLVYIPTSKSYLSMNLSHACSIVLYELFKNECKKEMRMEEASTIEREKFYEFFNRILEHIDYKEHKKRKTKAMFKRIMGRAVLTKWEFYTFMGLIKEIEKRLK